MVLNVFYLQINVFIIYGLDMSLNILRQQKARNFCEIFYIFCPSVCHMLLI